MERYERKRSWIWFLFPVFFQIIGGLIAYFALKPDEPRMAKDCLYIGAVLTGINLGTFLIFLAIGFSMEESFYREFEREFRNDMIWGV